MCILFFVTLLSTDMNIVLHVVQYWSSNTLLLCSVAINKNWSPLGTGWPRFAWPANWDFLVFNIKTCEPVLSFPHLRCTGSPEGTGWPRFARPATMLINGSIAFSLPFSLPFGVRGYPYLSPPLPCLPSVRAKHEPEGRQGGKLPSDREADARVYAFA